MPTRIHRYQARWNPWNVTSSLLICQHESKQPLCSPISFWALIPICLIHQWSWLVSFSPASSPTLFSGLSAHQIPYILKLISEFSLHIFLQWNIFLLWYNIPCSPFNKNLLFHMPYIIHLRPGLVSSLLSIVSSRSLFLLSWKFSTFSF